MPTGRDHRETGLYIYIFFNSYLCTKANACLNCISPLELSKAFLWLPVVKFKRKVERSLKGVNIPPKSNGTAAGSAGSGREQGPGTSAAYHTCILIHTIGRCVPGKCNGCLLLGACLHVSTK